MAYDNQDTGERQMFQGNWKCSSCGGAITKLPFKPDQSREGELLCKECHKQKRDERPHRNDGSRQMHQGNWTCSSCGGSITQLPFRPDPSRANQLKCRDCFRK